MDSTLLGMSMVVSALQFWKAAEPRLLRVFLPSQVTEARAAQPKKAPLPMT